MDLESRIQEIYIGNLSRRALSVTPYLALWTIIIVDRSNTAVQ